LLEATNLRYFFISGKNGATLFPPVKLGTLPFSMDEFTIAFIDVTAGGGKLAMMWDKTLATVPFKIGSQPARTRDFRGRD
jgi:hypothetical protein